jgi:hypothetical protein
MPRHRARPLGVDVGATDTGALSREALGNGLANPVGRSGDERDLALQLFHCDVLIPPFSAPDLR